MGCIFVVGEDQLCLAFGRRLVEFVLPGWTVAGAIDKRGVSVR